MSQRHDANRIPGGGDDADRPGHIPDELVDRFFDDELSEPERRAFLQSLPADLARCEDVAKTRRAIDLLRAGSVPAPDLTGRIIATVDSRRGFASRRVRQMARVVRLGLAAGVVLFAGAIAAVERVAPDATRLVPAPTPLTTAIRESQAEMASTSGAVATWFEALRHGVQGDAARDHLHTLEWRQQQPADPALVHDAPHTMVVRVAVEGDAQPTPHGVSVGPRQIMVLHTVTDVGTDVGTDMGTDTGQRTGQIAGQNTRNIAFTAAFTPASGQNLAQDRNGLPVRLISTSAFGMKSESREAAWERVRQSRRASLIYDVDGRCSGVVTPLGVHTGTDESRPFVLPGARP
ncbi:MAG: hypothetical protein R3B68_01330 [Phycisphaerales bacterium]